MDVLSRFTEDSETLRALADAVRGQILTAIPVRVTKDSDGHTAALQPLVKAVRRKPDGSQELVDFPLIPSAPINHVSGGGMTISMPVKEKDIGFALVMSRSIDVYQQQSGQQPQIDIRMHDLSDAIYCPGLKPDPDKLQNYSSDAIQVRTNDGKHMVALHPENGPSLMADDGKHTVSVNPKSGIAMKTAMALAVEAKKGMSLKGDLDVTGAVQASKSVSAPTLNGQTGGGFTGAMGAFVGAIVGAGLVLFLHGTGRQQMAVAGWSLPAVAASFER